MQEILNVIRAVLNAIAPGSLNSFVAIFSDPNI